jgi:hypothetical protein
MRRRCVPAWLVTRATRELSANVSNLSTASFERAIESFSAQIRDETDPVLHETLICDFSTTAPASRVASEVALTDTFSSYFTYVMACVCGIPQITIQGSPEDWLRIRARVEVLSTYEPEWWVSRLRPILDEFALAVRGQPTTAFWKAIYKPEKAYSTTLTAGWTTDFFLIWVMLASREESNSGDRFARAGRFRPGKAFHRRGSPAYQLRWNSKANGLIWIWWRDFWR